MKKFLFINAEGLKTYQQFKEEYSPSSLAKVLDIFGTIDDIMGETQATDEEYLTIGYACEEGWRKCEGVELVRFVENVMNAYVSEELTLEEIKNYSPRDLVNDFYEWV